MTKDLHLITPFHHPGGIDTPEVFLSEMSESFIRGKSLPENAFEFYQPVLNWITQFSRDSLCQEWRLELAFDYFNSTTGRYIYEILHILEKMSYRCKVHIVWKYETDDDLIRERGESFATLSSLPFEFVDFKRS